MNNIVPSHLRTTYKKSLLNFESSGQSKNAYVSLKT